MWRSQQTKSYAQKRGRKGNLAELDGKPIDSNHGFRPRDGLANRCFRPLSHLSVFNSPESNELWSLSLHYTATFVLRSTIATTLSLVRNRRTALRLASSFE